MLTERLQKKYSSLTRQQKKVADFLLANGPEAAFLPVAQLARQVKTSQATVIRFSRAIGFHGYPELQKEMRVWIKEKISPAEALQKSIADPRKEDIYSRIFRMDDRNLAQTQRANTQETIDRAVAEIIGAKKVGVTGFRSAYSMAFLLSFFLGQVRKNCELLSLSAGILPNQLIHYGSGDLMIGISFPRYGSPTLDILKFGKKAGCKILAITDSPISPIGQVADLVLIAGNKSPTYFNSFSSVVSLINCLVAGVSLKRKHSVEVLKDVNQIVDDWKLLLI